MHNLSALYNNSANVQLFYPQNPEEACLTNGVIIGKIFSFLTDVKSQVSFMTANKHIYYVLNDRKEHPETTKKVIRALAGDFHNKSIDELVSFFEGLPKEDKFICTALIESQDSAKRL